ncbi:hypothetical protein L0657_09940 [Dyadobacter sp. CY345]|uniref:hypothetical protein n=1 Tax=Dyadobacter sp. CY345 TaxID=2909335 RepID=UPI001F299FB5|nr:hypothetical protein [Dyadobacter sp. CY345]MCF2444276.1 hypothetical protein [Dyadobacter sp. CY345]
MNSAALFQILYQHDVLFQVPGEIIIAPQQQENLPEIIDQPELVETKSETPTLKQTVSIPVSTVREEAVQPTKPAVPQTQFPVLNHKVLILVDEPKQREMLVSEALFLDNVLKAVGHSPENSDILNFSFLSGPDARSVLSEKRINYFITFGVPLIKLHLDLLLPPYTPKQVEGIWFLLTDPLPVIEADRDLKKKLWTALKQMFPKS